MEWHDPRTRVAGAWFDRVDGTGATPNGGDIEHFGATVLMRPSAYLALAHRLHHPRAGSMDHLVEAIKAGTPIAPAYLSVEMPRRPGALPAVYGHEGRHRMSALRKVLGDVPVPVHLLVPGGKARSLTDERIGTLRDAMFDQDRLMKVHGPLFGAARVSGRTVEFPEPPRHNHVTGHVPFEPLRATEEFLAEAVRHEGDALALGEALAVLRGMDQCDFEDYGEWLSREMPDRRKVLGDMLSIAAKFGPATCVTDLIGPVEPGAAPAP